MEDNKKRIINTVYIVSIIVLIFAIIQVCLDFIYGPTGMWGIPDNILPDMFVICMAIAIIIALVIMQCCKNKSIKLRVLIIIFCIIPYLFIYFGPLADSWGPLSAERVFHISFKKQYYNFVYDIEKININKHLANYDEDLFIHNNKIYYIESREEIEHGSRLYQMDLDGKNHRKLCYIDDAMFYSFSYKNNVYFTGYKGFNRINLNTCKVDQIIRIPEEEDGFTSRLKGNNGKNTILASGQDDFVKPTSLYEYDLNSNKIIRQQDIMEITEGKSIVIDSNNLDEYYISTDYDEKCIRKNNDCIYDKSAIDVIKYKDNYLYFYDKNNVYKFNVNTKQIENKVVNKYKKIQKIDNYGNHFKINKSIYIFNENTMEFSNIVDNKQIDADVDLIHVYKHKDIYAIIYGYSDDETTDTNVFVYNTKKGKKYEQKKLVFAQIDNNKIYAINKKVKIKIIDLNKFGGE